MIKIMEILTTNHTSRYVKERQKNAGFIDE